MASVSKKRPDGRYQARWRLTPNGKQFSKLFNRKPDAERHIAKVTADIDRGVYVDPKAGRETVAAYAERWMKQQVWRPSTRASVVRIIEGSAVVEFGDRPMSSIRRSDVNGWVSKLSESLAPSTVRNHASTLASMFNEAVLDDIIVKSPMVRINLPATRKSSSTLVPLTTEQVHALAAEIPLRYRGAVLAQAGLGLRQGELRGLTIDRIDFLRRTVTIDRQLDPARKPGSLCGVLQRLRRRTA
jgi:integrase